MRLGYEGDSFPYVEPPSSGYNPTVPLIMPFWTDLERLESGTKVHTERFVNPDGTSHHGNDTLSKVKIK